ncbi:MAG: hypothetical protein CL526_04775 [Aequorivita sp.]|nr:hypothetical protein [Aequorivita sp.]
MNLLLKQLEVAIFNRFVNNFFKNDNIILLWIWYLGNFESLVEVFVIFLTIGLIGVCKTSKNR